MAAKESSIKEYLIEHLLAKKNSPTDIDNIIEQVKLFNDKLVNKVDYLTSNEYIFSIIKCDPDLYNFSISENISESNPVQVLLAIDMFYTHVANLLFVFVCYYQLLQFKQDENEEIKEYFTEFLTELDRLFKYDDFSGNMLTIFDQLESTVSEDILKTGLFHEKQKYIDFMDEIVKRDEIVSNIFKYSSRDTTSKKEKISKHLLNTKNAILDKILDGTF